MKKQKLYRYNKPAEEGKKPQLILCYANNEAHAMQVLRERFTDADGNVERIDKTLITEYVEKPKQDKKNSRNKKKGAPKA